jgi:transposase InsO family protein
MDDPAEYEKRYQAIQLYEQGTGFTEVLRIVQRARAWLCKWLKRYRQEGLDGLREHSRAPRCVWRKTPEALVKRIITIREELESHKTRRSAFSGIGPEVIHWELTRRNAATVPSLSTISRIIARHCRKSCTKPTVGTVYRPYPSPAAKRMGDLHQTDIVGPRYLRGPKGVTRFYSFHTIDVAGHTAHASQFPDKQTISLCRHLIETWRRIGMPTVSQLDNEMAAAGGWRYRYSLSQVIRLHLLMGIHVVFIPTGEPGRNASVESFNDLWQERVLRRHACPTLAALRRTSERFLRYYHYDKPHRKLTHKEHATRFPGVLRDALWGTTRQMPDTFCLDEHIDARGHLQLPIARGKVSFIRQVDTKGHIEVNGASYFIRRKYEGQYVTATLFTHKKNLIINLDNTIIKSFAFSIDKKIAAPLLAPCKRRV